MWGCRNAKTEQMFDAQKMRSVRARENQEVEKKSEEETSLLFSLSSIFQNLARARVGAHFFSNRTHVRISSIEKNSSSRYIEPMQELYDSKSTLTDPVRGARTLVSFRMDRAVFEMIEAKVGSGRERRIGGVSDWIRQLIYGELGLGVPPNGRRSRQASQALTRAPKISPSAE